MDSEVEEDTRHWRRGSMMQVFVVTCMKCLTEATSFSYDRKKVIQQAELAGWVMVGGHWFCPNCKRSTP